MTENLDITEPLRLARGSHAAGSGKGCAMNVVSWENGDITITDFPTCAARPLARLVQVVNDAICAHTQIGKDLLCPACSMIVLDLAHATVGTADPQTGSGSTAGATREQVAAWLAELLDSPSWGVSRFALGNSQLRQAIAVVADLCWRRAAGNNPDRAEWQECVCVTKAALSGITCASAAALHAANAALYVAKAGAGTSPYKDSSMLNSASAAMFASYAAGADRLEHARAAISAWHRICGTAPEQPGAEIVQRAFAAMRAQVNQAG